MIVSSLLGDFQIVEEKYERSKRIFGGNWYFGDESISINRLEYKDFITTDDIVFSNTKRVPGSHLPRYLHQTSSAELMEEWARL